MKTITRTTHESSRLLRLIPLCALALVAGAPDAARAAPNAEVQATLADIEKETGGFVPAFLKALPDNALPGAWAEMKGIWASSATALPCKIKDIMGVAVASQIPSKAEVEGHSILAKASGATQAQITEGVTIAAMARHWSTFFNGIQLDEGKFRSEIARLVQGAKAGAAAGATPPGKPIVVVDARTAQEDMKQSFGFVPEFATKFPAAGLAGAWRQMRDVEMNPSTELSPKYKSLVSLAVASQIPCRYCVIADTEFAKLDGATDQEISEAIAMAGIVRHNATILIGLSIDDGTFRKDMTRIARHIARSAKTGDARAARVNIATPATLAAQGGARP
jgi:AhpD family alkylhydroperoxidase